MDLILDEEIEKVYAADKKAVEAEIKEAKESVDYSLKTETYASQHELYLELPNKVVVSLIRFMLCPLSEEYKQIMEFHKSGESFSKLSAIKCINLGAMDDKFNDLKWDFLLKRLEKGWNSGCSANSFLRLNKLAASRAQLEFIPYKEGKHTFLFAHKVRYNAVPYLPYQGSHFGVNFAFRVGAGGLEPREIPNNLKAALHDAKSLWKPRTLADLYLKSANAFMPGQVKSHINMALVLGANIDRLNKAYEEIDPSVALLIQPHRKETSIFAGVNLPLWAAFFEGFAEDVCGPVSVARMLAALPYASIYGKVDDVAVWSSTPKVLKTPNRLESIVKHVYIDFNSFNEWPKKALVYNPTPRELNSYIYAMGSPVALGMPLTAVISNSPQVSVYCALFTQVVVEVYFCTTPMVIFRPAKEGETGLDGRGMKDYLIGMEKAIVKGFLEVIKLKVNDANYTGFSILPGVGHSAATLSISVKPLKIAASYVSTRFMQMTDAELARFVPTARVTDVTIDGVSAKKKKTDLVPQYPRAMPTLIDYNNNIRVGKSYKPKGMEELIIGLKIDPYTWKLKDPVTGKELPTEEPTVVSMKAAKKEKAAKAKAKKEAKAKAEAEAKAAADAAAAAGEKKDEKEEGEVAEPARDPIEVDVEAPVGGAVVEAPFGKIAVPFKLGALDPLPKPVEEVYVPAPVDIYPAVAAELADEGAMVD